MKRALAVVLAVCMLGVVGFGITLKGRWKTDIRLLPAPVDVTSTLDLTYTLAGFDITSTTVFGATGITDQSFGLKGALGPFSLTGGMAFQPSPPEYLRAWLTTSFDFAGVKISSTIRHWLRYSGVVAPPIAPRTTFPIPDWGTVDPCPEVVPPTPTPPPTVAAGLQSITTLTVAPVSVRLRLLDCSTGFAFQDLLVSLTKIPLCCGIAFDADFLFIRTGFSYLEIKGINIPLCCGVSFDVAIRYMADGKSITITPRFAGFAEACFTVWGRPVVDAPSIFTAIRVDAFQIRCVIADCNYLEYVHAFDPASPAIPRAIRDKFSAACGEEEYIELGFCGPGCCGGKYEVVLRIMQAVPPHPAGVTPGLFGWTRFIGTLKIPVMVNLTFDARIIMPIGTCVPAVTPSFWIGWTFTF